MPSLRMKSRSNKDYIGGDKLRTCRKSSKITKGSHPDAKTSQILDDTQAHVTLDASNVAAVSSGNMDTAETTEPQDLDLQALTPLWQVPLSAADATLTTRHESLSVGCHSVLKTIISSILDHGKLKDAIVDHNIEDKEQTNLPHLVPDDSEDGSCSLNDCRPSSAIECSIPDLSVTLPFDESTGFSNAIPDYCTDHDHADYGMMFDLQERCMILPFIERTRQGCDIQYENSVEEAAVNSDDSCLYLAIHQMKSSSDDADAHLWNVDDLGSFDPQLFIKILPDFPETVSSCWPMLLRKETPKRKAITLVLDLDETLVHSTLEHCADADFTFPVYFNLKEHTVYVRQRPYLHLFLERVAQMFEVVIFTASQSIYAEHLLDILDPGRKLISQRIYRESCIFLDGSYTKDLTVLGVDLAKVVIIDNCPQVFRLQVNNGIPIKSWFGDPSDCALISLLPFLERLVDVDDVRPIIAERFNKE